MAYINGKKVLTVNGTIYMGENLNVDATPQADTSAHILAFTENKGIYVGTDTGHWYGWDGTQYVDGGVYMSSVIPNKMLMNLALYCPKLAINSVNRTITIDATTGYIFNKFRFVPVSNIATKTISYDGLTTDTYYLYIRSNTLGFATLNTDCQQTDIIIWIGYITNGSLNREVYNADNRRAIFALSSSASVTIDTTNKNFVIGNGYLWHERGYFSVSSTTVSYSSYTNRTAVLLYRYNSWVVMDYQSYVNTMVVNDIIVAIIWFSNSGLVNRKIFLVNDTQNQISSLDNRVTTLENATTETLPKSSKIFMRVGCIGDSYTSGWINDNTHKNNPNYSWCKYMKQLTGNEWTNFGVSGSSTKSWIDGTSGKLSEVQAQGNKCQAYVIGLMINDQNSGAAHYVALGTSADIGTDANSYYAYYYKLINACLTVNPDAKIFCNTCPKTGGSFSSYNQAVVDIVTYCQNENKNVYLVDLRNYDWTNSVFVSDALNGHYTAIGYEYMAEMYNKALSDLINNNVTDFQDVNLIPYDALED